MRLTSSLQYRMDWITQRTGEGLLYLRYYWWCGQFFIIALVPAVYRCGGVWGLVYLCGRAYVYEERHGWGQENARSAVELIEMLRRESELRAFRGLFDSPPQSDDTHYGHHYVTPLMDRNPNPWTDTAVLVLAGVVPMPDKVDPYKGIGEHPCGWDDPGEGPGVFISALPTIEKERVPA